jgi:hypothetical protein
MILPSVGTILQILLCGYRTYLYFLKRPFTPSPYIIKCAETFEAANNVQLGLAIVYCFVALTVIRRIDAYHLRYLLDQAILSSLSKTLSTYIVYYVKGFTTTSPSKAKLVFWKNAILHSIFSVLFLAAGIVYELKLKHFWHSDPSCFYKLFYSDTMGVGILIAAILLLIQIRCMFPPQTSNRSCIGILSSWSWTLGLGILSPIWIVLVVVFDIINYDASKMYLHEPESKWGIGQVLPPLFLGVTIVGLIYRGFWEVKEHEGTFALWYIS